MIGSLNLDTEKKTNGIIGGKKSHPRAKFTQEEDEKLSKLVQTFGTSDWISISYQMPGRNSRQCRDRWQNYLSPEVVNGPWTAEEEDLLVKKYNEFGPSWKQIATFFPTRTDINIKSRWHLRERRLKKEDLQMKRALFRKNGASKASFPLNTKPVQQHPIDFPQQMNLFPQYNQINPKYNPVNPINQQVPLIHPSKKANLQYLMPIIKNSPEKSNQVINSSPLPFFPSKVSSDEQSVSEMNISTDDGFDSATNDCLNLLLMNDENNFYENVFDTWF